jgi:hypothetical protein
MSSCEKPPSSSAVAVRRWPFESTTDTFTERGERARFVQVKRST